MKESNKISNQSLFMKEIPLPLYYRNYKVEKYHDGINNEPPAFRWEVRQFCPQLMLVISGSFISDEFKDNTAAFIKIKNNNFDMPKNIEQIVSTITCTTINSEIKK